MRSWDFVAPAGKIELAMKTLKTLLSSTDQQWTDQARRQFQQNHLEPIEPNVKRMLDAIGQLTEVLSAAERACSDEGR